MRALIAVTAMCMAAAGPARAAWQWTTWDMTPSQLISASQGRVSPAAGGPDDRVYDADIGGKGSYSENGFDFDAEFYFDGANRLNVVRLLLRDRARCDELGAATRGLYGEPSEADDYQTRWRDEAHDNWIGFTQLPADYNMTCFLIYRPLATSGADGF
jgi:hypothetical protein